jgi:hypothetical protein
MPSGTVSRWVVTHLAANIKAHSNRSVLRPRRHHDARELRVRRAIAAPARDQCEGAKERALHRQRRRTEHDHIAELPQSEGSLQRIRHALTVCMPEPCEAEEGLDHVQKPFAWCDLHPYAGVAVARIPPVVPYAGLDDGRLASTKNAGLPVALHGQLTLEYGELLDKSGMAVFPHHTRPNERREFGGPAACRVVPRTLEDRGAFPGDGVLPDLADSYRCAIRRAVRVGCDM